VKQRLDVSKTRGIVPSAGLQNTIELNASRELLDCQNIVGLSMTTDMRQKLGVSSPAEAGRTEITQKVFLKRSLKQTSKNTALL
jgi:hypothetical protein